MTTVYPETPIYDRVLSDHQNIKLPPTGPILMADIWQVEAIKNHYEGTPPDQARQQISDLLQRTITDPAQLTHAEAEEILTSITERVEADGREN